MGAPLAIAAWAQASGIVAAALLAAAAVLAPTVRTRAAATAGALVLTPVLLLGEIWDTPQVQSIRDRPGPAVAAAALGLALVVGLAAVLARTPWLLAPLAALALPFRVPVEAGGSSANLLVPLYAVVAAGALAWVWRAARGHGPPRRREPGALEWLLLGSVVLYAVQGAYSSDLEQALENVVFFFIPFALLFGMLRELRWTTWLAQRCLLVLAGLALVFVLVGFVEYQQRELLLNPKVIGANQYEDYFRVNSLFFDPNIYGRFLAVVMVLLASAMVWTRRRGRVLVLGGLLALLWAGLVLTFSQSSFAALLLGLAVLAALRFGVSRAAAVAAAAVVIGVVIVLAFGSSIRVDLGSSKSLDNTTSGRVDLIQGGLDLFREAPVLGHGSGSFAREYRTRQNASSERAVSASHTIPVTILAEQGVPGLLVYVALLVAAFLRLLRGAAGDPVRAGVAAAFAGLVLHTWTYAAFLEDPLTWALLGAGVGLAAASAKRGEIAEREAARAVAAS
jgi:O-antigen ligase